MADAFCVCACAHRSIVCGMPMRVLQSELVRTHYGRYLFEVGDELERETEVAHVAATSGSGTESRWDTALGNDFGLRNPHAASARLIANGHLGQPYGLAKKYGLQQSTKSNNIQVYTEKRLMRIIRFGAYSQQKYRCESGKQGVLPPLHHRPYGSVARRFQFTTCYRFDPFEPWSSSRILANRDSDDHLEAITRPSCPRSILLAGSKTASAQHASVLASRA